MKALYIIIAVIFLYPFYSRGQHKELDSLSVILPTVADSNRVSILKRMVFVWSDINPDSARHYITILRSLGKKMESSEAIIYADVKLAELHNMNGNFTEAMQLNRTNLEYALKSGTPYQTADVYKTMAMSFSMQEKNDSALRYYLEALKIYEGSSDSLNMGRVMTNMAVVHDNVGDYAKSIEYCSRSAAIFKNRDRHAYLITLTNLALYQAYDKQFNRSRHNYEEALKIATADNNYSSLAHIYSGLLDLSYLQKKYGEMLPYAQQFEKIARDMQNDYVLLRAKLSMAKALFFNKRFAEAESYFNDALRLSDQLEDNALLKDVYGMYSYLLLNKGDIEGFDTYRQKIDSLVALENKHLVTRNTRELEAKYETEKKDNQIQLQEANIRQKQLWNYSLAGLVIALSLIGFVSWRNYRNKRQLLEKEKTLQQNKIVQLEQEKQLAATQAVLQGQDEERIRLAKDLHDGLGGMLSGVKFSFINLQENLTMDADNQQAFGRNMDMLDGVAYELRKIAHNMMPDTLDKFGLDAALHDMCRYMQQSGALEVNYRSLGLKELKPEKNISMNIYRIIQELLNNIVKHAKATEAIVQVTFSQPHFSITVEDNGRGFDTGLLNNGHERPGMGWNNIQNRVSALKGTMDIQSSAQGGTSVLIEFTV